MAWSSPRTWTTGETVTAAHMNQEVRDNLNAGFPDAVTSNDWDPALEATTTDPSNIATTDGAEYQIGALHFVWARFVFDATTTEGSGSWFVTLPSTAANIGGSSNGGTAVGSWVLYEDSGADRTAGASMLSTSTTVRFVQADTSTEANLVSDASPFDWGGGLGTMDNGNFAFNAVYPFA